MEWEIEKQEAVEAAVLRVVDDLTALTEILGHIDQMFERIRSFQIQLEERLRNMLRYKNRARRDYAKRLDAVIGRLVSVLSEKPHLAREPLVEGYLDSSERFFGVALHTTPRRERIPLGVAAVKVSEPDPVDLHLRDLKNSYLRRLHPGDREVAAFIDRAVGTASDLDAADFPMQSIDDFLAFDALLLMVRRNNVPPAISSRFRIESARSADRVNNAYLSCENFRVVREGSADVG